MDGPGAVGCLRFDPELGIGKTGIGESVAEREERLDPELVVASIADSGTLGKVGYECVRGVLRRLRNRGVTIATWESDRQLA